MLNPYDGLSDRINDVLNGDREITNEGAATMANMIIGILKVVAEFADECDLTEYPKTQFERDPESRSIAAFYMADMLDVVAENIDWLT